MTNSAVCEPSSPPVRIRPEKDFHTDIKGSAALSVFLCYSTSYMIISCSFSSRHLLQVHRWAAAETKQPMNSLLHLSWSKILSPFFPPVSNSKHRDSLGFWYLRHSVKSTFSTSTESTPVPSIHLVFDLHSGSLLLSSCIPEVENRLRIAPSFLSFLRVKSLGRHGIYKFIELQPVWDSCLSSAAQSQHNNV